MNQPQSYEVELESRTVHVPQSSHIAHYYRGGKTGDDFARKNVQTGLRNGEFCILYGDPHFTDRIPPLLSDAPPGGWRGRLFVLAVTAPPSEEALDNFLDTYIKVMSSGPVGLLSEVPIRTNQQTLNEHRLRIIGNWRHWWVHELGSLLMLNLCARLVHIWKNAPGIVICQWDVAEMPTHLRWGELAVHSHMVENDNCVADPVALLENHFRQLAVMLEGSAAKLQLILALGEPADGLGIARSLESAATETRNLISPLGTPP